MIKKWTDGEATISVQVLVFSCIALYMCQTQFMSDGGES